MKDADEKRGEAPVGKVRVRHGNDEIEVEGSDQFIAKQLERFYQRVGEPGAAARTTLKEQLLEKPSVSKPQKAPTPAEFFKARGKTDGVSQILIFAKYLEDYANQSEFTPKEINDVARDAKLSKDIHTQYFTNAVRQGLLRKKGQKYSLTLSAEEVLASMSPA